MEALEEQGRALAADMRAAGVRWFSVTGTLQIAGVGLISVWQEVHADDVPPGEPGCLDIAERVKHRLLEQYAAPAGRWAEVRVREYVPSMMLPEGLP